MLASWVVSAFPKSGGLYCEPFAGRGNVFFRAAQTLTFRRWSLNDITTAGFFRAMKATTERVACPLQSAATFEEHKGRAQAGDPLSLMLEPYLSFSGGGYRSGGPNVAARYPDKIVTPAGYSETLYRAGILLRRHAVAITSISWDLLPLDWLGPDDFVYFDPPYYNCSVRAYDANLDYDAFVRCLQGANFRWILSEYEAAPYAPLGSPFERQPRRLLVSDQKRVKSPRVECLWKNF